MFLTAYGPIVEDQQNAGDEKPHHQSDNPQVADGHAEHQGKRPEIRRHHKGRQGLGKDIDQDEFDHPGEQRQEHQY